jgi:transcriptional regulator with XRE-family HTH domain
MPHSPDDLRVLATWLRTFRDLSQVEMAMRAGRSKSTISLYESGGIVPSPGAIERLAGAVGVPLWVVEGVLLPVISIVREVGGAPGSVASDPCQSQVAAAALADQAASAAVRLGIAKFLSDLECEIDQTAATRVHHDKGQLDEDLWRLLAGYELQPIAAKLHTEFERLIERIGEESARAAARDGRLALELARLALRVADVMPGDPAARSRGRGYAQGFVANALRVDDDLRGAEAAIADAWRLWRAAACPGDSVLGEWRLLALEAALRRDQRRFGAALDCLDQALADAPATAKGRLLLSKAFILEQAGEIEGALAALREARPLVDAAGEPRDRMGVRFNTLVNLWHLGRHREAEELLPELRQLVHELGNEQDLTRLGWLSARLAASLGHREEALDGLLAAQRDFRDRGKGYDAALVSLDLALLYLDGGRTRDAAALAGQSAWIFSARDVHREVLAALRIFAEAAEREALSTDLVRRLRDELERPLPSGSTQKRRMGSGGGESLGLGPGTDPEDAR